MSTPPSVPSRSKSILYAPAIQALIIQCLSLVATLTLLYCLTRVMGLRATAVVAALLQGAIAALLSHWYRLAPWWMPIQFFFPGALILTLSFELPPAIFLIGFIFLLGLYWSTFRTQVPFFPSGPAVWDAVAAILPQDRTIYFADVGSGLGGLVLNLAGRHKESSFLGIELAPLPWLVSVLRAWLGQSQGRFIRGDYNALDFARFDVVFAYLSPTAMPELWDKARAEMRPGTLLLSYEFPILNEKSHIIMMPDTSGRVLFGWRM